MNLDTEVVFILEILADSLCLLDHSDIEGQDIYVTSCKYFCVSTD